MRVDLSAQLCSHNRPCLPIAPCSQAWFSIVNQPVNQHTLQQEGGCDGTRVQDTAQHDATTK